MDSLLRTSLLCFKNLSSYQLVGLTCIDFLSDIKTLILQEFISSSVISNPLTKEKKFVWQSSREAPLVWLFTFVIFHTSCLPQNYTISGSILMILGWKMRKCASVTKLWWRLWDTTSWWKAGFLLVNTSHVILAIKMADRWNWPEAGQLELMELTGGHFKDQTTPTLYSDLNHIMVDFIFN